MLGQIGFPLALRKWPRTGAFDMYTYVGQSWPWLWLWYGIKTGDATYGKTVRAAMSTMDEKEKDVQGWSSAPMTVTNDVGEV